MFILYVKYKLSWTIPPTNGTSDNNNKSIEAWHTLCKKVVPHTAEEEKSWRKPHAERDTVNKAKQEETSIISYKFISRMWHERKNNNVSSFFLFGSLAFKMQYVDEICVCTCKLHRLSFDVVNAVSNIKMNKYTRIRGRRKTSTKEKQLRYFCIMHCILLFIYLYFSFSFCCFIFSRIS